MEIIPNKGAMVCSFSIDDVWDIYDLRAVLEGYAARRAASKISSNELQYLEKLAGEMERIIGVFSDHEEETRKLVSLNNEFHGTIVVASRNRRLERLVQSTVQLPLVFKAFFWYGPHERMISNHYHRQILKALRSGEAERAEILMREHVYEGRDLVIQALREEAR